MVFTFGFTSPGVLLTIITLTIRFLLAFYGCHTPLFSIRVRDRVTETDRWTDRQTTTQRVASLSARLSANLPSCICFHISAKFSTFLFRLFTWLKEKPPASRLTTPCLIPLPLQSFLLLSPSLLDVIRLTPSKAAA